MPASSLTRGSSDLSDRYVRLRAVEAELAEVTTRARERAQEADLLRLGLTEIERVDPQPGEETVLLAEDGRLGHADALRAAAELAHGPLTRSEEHTSELPSLMRISYAVFCLK